MKKHLVFFMAALLLTAAAACAKTPAASPSPYRSPALSPTPHLTPSMPPEKTIETLKTAARNAGYTVKDESESTNMTGVRGGFSVKIPIGPGFTETNVSILEFRDEAAAADNAKQLDKDRDIPIQHEKFLSWVPKDATEAEKEMILSILKGSPLPNPSLSPFHSPSPGIASPGITSPGITPYQAR